MQNLKFFYSFTHILMLSLIAGVVNAEVSFGGYLAGRQALSTRDFDSASTYLNFDSGWINRQSTE